MAANSFSITRSLAGHRVRIEATRIDRLDIYGVQVFADGALWDNLQSDDVLGDATGIFEAAFIELAQPDQGAETA